MTNPDSSPKQRLVAVPPTRIKRDKKQSVPKQPSEKLSTPENNQSGNRGWWIAGGILLACGAISFIPVRPNIRAEAWIQPDPQGRSQIHAPVEGIVTEVKVKPDQDISVGTQLLVLETDSLDQEINAWELRLLENESEIRNAQQQILTTQTRANSVQNNLLQVQSRVNQLRTELDGMSQGIMPPEIAGYEAQIKSLSAQSDSVQTTVDRFTKLQKAGGASEEQVEDVKREKMAIEAQMGEFQAQKGVVTRRLQDELARKQEELVRLQNSYQVALQEAQAAQSTLLSLQEIRQQLEEELTMRLAKQEESTVIEAEVAGMVITQDLDMLEGKKLEKGDPILLIIDPKQLVAEIEVKQEDRDLVQEGATVIFSPPEPSLPKITTKIESIIEEIESDEVLDKSFVKVIAEIEDKDNKLQLGSKMYTRIESKEKITLGQQAWRQIVNLFKIRKYS